jgi:CubicO group peptidase (beta-lactamase class C family)
MITSVAVMQCVERNQVTLDEPISRVLPEWESPSILTGINPNTNEFILSKAKTPITLRHLLTHTSGLSYGASNPLMAEWVSRQVPALPKSGNVKRSYFLPLNFEPGTPGKWMYGSGIDWAGQVVERINGGIGLDDYFQANIFAPLGITSATFNPVHSKEYAARICPRVQRQEDGSLKMDPMELFPRAEPEEDSGGGGLYCTALDYHKILESIVSKDGILLNEASVDEMFRPQLPDHEELQETISQFSYAPVIGKDASGGSRGVRWNHCLAGLAAPDGVPHVAAKGTIWWDGLANTIWVSSFCFTVTMLTNLCSSWTGSQGLVRSMAHRCCHPPTFQRIVCSCYCRKS